MSTSSAFWALFFAVQLPILQARNTAFGLTKLAAAACMQCTAQRQQKAANTSLLESRNILQTATFIFPRPIVCSRLSNNINILATKNFRPPTGGAMAPRPLDPPLAFGVGNRYEKQFQNYLSLLRDKHEPFTVAHKGHWKKKIFRTIVRISISLVRIAYLLDTWYLMSDLVSRCFYMPHSAQSSSRFLKLFTGLAETTVVGRPFQMFTTRWLKKLDRVA